MTNTSRLTLILILSATSTFAGPARTEPTVEEIISRYAEARGGMERLRAVTSLIIHSQRREGDHFSADAVMALMRPYYKLVGNPDNLSPNFREGYDGSAWEFYGDIGVVLRVVSQASAALRHRSSFDGPLIDCQKHGVRIDYGGIVQKGGRRTFRLHAREQDGFEEDFYIDCESYLLVAERHSAPVHAFGTAINSETYFDDYRPVAGVLFPHSEKEVDTATGRTLNESRVKEIIVNRELEPAIFSPPHLQQTSLQLFFQQLYDSRSDLAAVRWTYHEFRTAHESLDTHTGIEFIGYEMLKMGDVQNGLALLELNAADYPMMASSAFALGRAYRTAGKFNAARKEFHRALRLDPSYSRASTALREMESGGEERGIMHP